MSEQQTTLERMQRYAAITGSSVAIVPELDGGGAFYKNSLGIELHPEAYLPAVFPHEMAHALLFVRRFSLPVDFQNSGAGQAGCGGIFTHHSPAFLVLAAALAADFAKERFDPVKHFSTQCFGSRWLYASPHLSAAACALYFATCFDFIERHAPPPLVAVDVVARMYLDAMYKNAPPPTQVFLQEPAALLGFGWIEKEGI